MNDLDYDTLSPKIRGAVRFLRERGFCTVDSGDGSNYDAGMDGALPHPHVFVQIDPPYYLIIEAESLALIFKDHPTVLIEAHYSPNDKVATIMVYELDRDGYLTTL